MDSSMKNKLMMISFVIMMVMATITIVATDSEESDAASYGTAANPRTSVSLTWAQVNSNNYTEIYVQSGSSFSITHTTTYSCFSFTDEYGSTLYSGSAYGLTLSSNGNLSGTVNSLGSTYVTYNDESGMIAIPYNVTVYIVSGPAPSGTYTETIHLSGWDSWDYRTYNPSTHTFSSWSQKYYADGPVYVYPNHHLYVRWNSTSLITGVDSYMDRISSSQYGGDLGNYVTVTSDSSYYPAYQRVEITVYNTHQSGAGYVYVSVVDDYLYGMFLLESVDPGQSEIIYVPAGCTIELEGDPNSPYLLDYWNVRSSTTSSSNPFQYSIGNNLNTIIDAYWKATPYTLYLNANGGTVSPSSTTVYYGWGYGNLPVPTRQGYGFDGWYTSSTGGTQVTSSTSVPYSSTGTITIYAHWTANNYTVTFDASTNGGYPNSTSSVTFGSTYGTLPTASKAGCTFSGWYTSSTGGTQVTSSTTVPYSATGTITLYAQFTVNTYTITINAQAGGHVTVYEKNNSSNTATAQAGGTASITIPYDHGIVLTAYPNNNYHFIGWDSDGFDNTNPREFTNITWDRTYTGYFGAGSQYTVTFDYATNGGTGVSYETKTVINGQEYGDLPVAIKQGTEFKGWYTLPSGGTKILSTTRVNLSDDQTLYAQFTLGPLTITVSTENGSVTVTDGVQTMTVLSGTTDTMTTSAETVTITATAAEGYNFNYWNYFWNGDTQSPGGFENDNPWELTLMGNVEIFGIFSQTLIPKTYYGYVNNSSYGSITNGDSTGSYLTGTVNVGDRISINANRLTIGTLTITANPSGVNVFSGWNGVTDGQVVQNSDVNITFTANFSNPYEVASVWWDNGYVNGFVNIEFDFVTTQNNYTHEMIIPLVIYDGIKGDADGIDYFSASPYSLSIVVPYNGQLQCTLIGNGQTITGTFKTGSWVQFTLDVDAQKGTVTFNGTRSLGWNASRDFTFLNYETVFTEKIFDFSSEVTGLAISKIYHEDTGNGMNHPRFQVSATTTFLDTYGFVMIDPTLNIYSQFPNYDNLRLNLYSFAVYGETITVNGHQFTLQGSRLSDLYYTVYTDDDDNEHYVIANASTEGAVKYDATLSNIYITWTNITSQTAEDRQCYLTFADDKKTIEMGSYPLNDLMISFTGIWYFTTALYEPYTAHETVYSMDWGSWFNLSGDAFLLVIAGLLIILTVAFSMIWKPSIIDYAVIIGCGVVSYILIGGL